ncbi:glycosyltransferase family 2 protein [Azospirillum sp. SYSU D00513]|uniref:glycosyltransferase family 2 protein n=1 Tax=Azospirillum sp. SYSU D00513 TaxID=2812561 RepID=UPI001A95EBD9|nr:glycosyltransferase family 2 protein [Azospirillum sp. SYSU D00513]
MSSPTVSVVIPAYNARKYIGAAIESALSQTLDRTRGRLEVLVVDDASTDDTAALVERMAGQDSRVRLIRRTENGGPSAGRNLGLAEARGAWIATLDADDWMEADRLEGMIAVGEGAGADLVADNLTVHDERTGEVRHAFRPWPSDPSAPVSALDFCRLDRPGLRDMGLGYAKPMIRSAFLNRHGLRYAEDVRVGEDFDFFMRCLMRGGRLVFTNAPGYHYTRRWNTASLTSETQAYENLIRVNRRLLEEARAGQDPVLARELATRQRMLDSHAPFRDFREAVKSRRYGQGACHLVRLPFHPYAMRRLARALLLRLKERARHRAAPGGHPSVNGVAGGD